MCYQQYAQQQLLAPLYVFLPIEHRPGQNQGIQIWF